MDTIALGSQEEQHNTFEFNQEEYEEGENDSIKVFDKYFNHQIDNSIQDIKTEENLMDDLSICHKDGVVKAGTPFQSSSEVNIKKSL